MKGVAEEVVETTEAYVVDKHQPTAEAINKLASELGDIYVFWINACYAAHVDPAHAINTALEKVLGRDGTTVNGRFVKEST
jgi:NTP pyrophosphatase (non-canonical NTP hydrolase)